MPSNLLHRLRLGALLSALTLTLAGCQTYVTVTSSPEGALITDPSGTVQYGYAPVDIKLNKDALEATIDPTDPKACAKWEGVVATWPSGAKAHTPNPMAICDLKFGATVQLLRPADAPNENTDLKWALDRAQQRAKSLEEENKRLETYLNSPFGWFVR